VFAPHWHVASRVIHSADGCESCPDGSRVKLVRVPMLRPGALGLAPLTQRSVINLLAVLSMAALRLGTDLRNVMRAGRGLFDMQQNAPLPGRPRDS
jgi:hypothetical protein